MRKFLSTLGALALVLVAAGAAQAISLTALLGGGSIQVNDKLFDDWQVIFEDTSDFHAVNTDNIEVSGLVDGGLDPGPGLQFDILNNEFDVTGDGLYAYTDFSFGFHVSVLDPLYKIKDNSLRLESASLLNITDDLGMYILEDITDAAGNLLGTKNVEFSQLVGVGGTSDLTDTAEFDPQSEIWVTKNILVWATDPGETASLGRFSQRFSQVPIPEPSTWWLMGLGLVGLAGAGRKMAVRA
jgi:hypothetical protein